MKRKILSTLLAITLLFSLASFNVFANQTVTVYLDNQPLQFDVPPQIINGRTMVPMRVIFEKLGAEVSWDNNTNTAHAYNDVRKGVSITIGAPHMVDIYNNIIPLDVPAVVQDGRTLVPLRAISEAFRCDVQWDGDTSSVKIYSEEFVDFSNSTGTQEEIKVATPEQLLNSIGNNKKIILTSNYYNLSTVKNVNNEHIEKQLNWDETYLNAYIIKNVVNMTIEGNAEIVVDDLSADVLSFEKCGNITLKGLTVGHSTYYEEYACEGAVTSFYICEGVYINNCNLFGCGAIGVSADSVKNLQVNNSNIYDCTFTGMHLSNTNATVKNTQFYDSYHWGGFIMLVNSVADFSNCNIHDIKTDPGSIFAFIDIDDYLNSSETKLTFTNCNFYNNSFINLASATAKNITFNNCTLNNNSGNMQHSYIVYNNRGSQTQTTPTVSYDDISANINQINDMINKGLYLEAIQECKNARDWHNLSPDNTNTINSLQHTAQQKYDAYVEQQKEANKNKVVTDSQKRQIYEIVKKHVSMQLKSPSTAIWPDYTQLMYAYNAEGRISVMGEVEAMNGFGGYGRVNYLFTFNEDLSIDFKYVY